MAGVGLHRASWISRNCTKRGQSFTFGFDIFQRFADILDVAAQLQKVMYERHLSVMKNEDGFQVFFGTLLAMKRDYLIWDICRFQQHLDCISVSFR
jgi:hypothetical protein